MHNWWSKMYDFDQVLAHGSPIINKEAFKVLWTHRLHDIAKRGGWSDIQAYTGN